MADSDDDESGDDEGDDDESTEEEKEVEEDIVMGEGDEDNSDFEPPGDNFDIRLIALEARLDRFITKYSADREEDRHMYQCDTSMMYHLQAQMFQMSFGEPLPNYFYDPYDPNAPSGSCPPPRKKPLCCFVVFSWMCYF